MKILIADDSKLVQTEIGSVVSTLGYDYHTADDGATAWEYFQAHQSEVILVFSDINMPNLTGIELSEKIRGAVGKAIPIIIVTANLDSELKRRGREIGVSAWVTKPINKDSLSGLLKSIMEKIK